MLTTLQWATSQCCARTEGIALPYVGVDVGTRQPHYILIRSGKDLKLCSIVKIAVQQES